MREFWCSGVIYPPSSDETSSIFDTLLRPLLYKLPDSRDNFVFALLPSNKKKKGNSRLLRTLFVSPEIAELNPPGVKGTFAHLSCDLIGILFNDEDLSKLENNWGGGLIFSFNTCPRDRLIGCVQKFETLTRIKTKLVMIDVGSDRLSSELLHTFDHGGFFIYRHPFDVIGDDIMYLNSAYNYFEIMRPPWISVPRHDGPIYYKINQKYPFMTQQLQTESGEKKSLEQEQVITDRLVQLHGPFDEIILDDKCDTKTGSNENESENESEKYFKGFDDGSSSEDDAKDEDYEFICKSEIIGKGEV